MPHVVLRFYGRFVFAEPFEEATSLGELNALAVNMMFNPDVTADPHRVVVTSLREVVRQPATTRLPDVMLMAATNDVDRAEHALWNLEGLRVDCVVARSDGPFEWHDRRMLADLLDLSGSGSSFDRAALQATDRGPVTSAIRIPAGSGVAEQLIPEVADLVRRGAPLGPSARPAVKLADKIDIKIPLPADEPVITLRLSTLAGQPAGEIVLGATGEIPMIVTFSNLCSRPSGELDEEFAGLYEVLQNPPIVAERLIPKGRPSEGRIQDCYTPAYVSFQKKT